MSVFIVKIREGISMSKKKKAVEAEEDATLAADIENILANFKERLDAAESEKDLAKKILDLRALDENLTQKRHSIIYRVTTAAHKRAVRSGKSRFKQAGLTLATLTIVALPYTAVYPDWYSRKSDAQKLQELRTRFNMDN